MKIFISGANGFIGRALSLGLVAKEQSVWGLGRRDIEPYIVNSELGYIQTDLQIESLRPLLSKHLPDIFINCAGTSTVREAHVNPKKDYEDTVLTTLNILEAIRKYSKKTKFILISSAAVYGEQKEYFLAESFMPKPTSEYGKNKLVAENIVRAYSSRFGLETLITRPFSVYSENIKKQVIYDICKKIMYGGDRLELHGTGNEVRDFIHVDDLVRGLETLIRNKSTGIVNLGTGIPTKISTLAHLLVKILGSGMSVVFDGDMNDSNPKIMVSDISLAKALGVEVRIDLAMGLEKEAIKLIKKC